MAEGQYSCSAKRSSAKLVVSSEIPGAVQFNRTAVIKRKYN
jgi:hypothetical protein